MSSTRPTNLYLWQNCDSIQEEADADATSAYALLSKQTETPEQDFKRILNTGKETTVKLEQKVPVHLVYFTAWPSVSGRMEYRRDVYGRDAALWAALEKAGVQL